MDLHRDAGHCWPGHADDVPLAIAEAVLAAMGRRHAQGARRRPRPSPAATAIDVFYHYRYIGTRGRGGRSRCGAHEGAPLRRRPPKRLWPAPGGQPFSQARCRAMAFAHHTVNGLAAGPPSHRAAPPRGHLGKMSKQQPTARRCAADFGFLKYFFAAARSRRQTIHQRSTRMFPDE